MGSVSHETIRAALNEVVELDLQADEVEASAAVDGADLAASQLFGEALRRGLPLNEAKTALIEVVNGTLVGLLGENGAFANETRALACCAHQAPDLYPAARDFLSGVACMADTAIEAFRDAGVPVSANTHVAATLTWALSTPHEVVFRRNVARLIRCVTQADAERDEQMRIIRTVVDAIATALNPTSFADAAE